MSGTSTKIFRNFFDPEVFIFIFQRRHNWENRKKKLFNIFDLYQLEKILKIMYYLW